MYTQHMHINIDHSDKTGYLATTSTIMRGKTLYTNPLIYKIHSYVHKIL